MRVLIVGLGLIGGSLGLALKHAEGPWHRIGFDRDTDASARAKALDVIDEIAPDLTLASSVDLVVLAVPIAALPAALSELSDQADRPWILTDVCSVKVRFIELVRQHLPDHLSSVVPGHPIAGNEKSGVDASLGELFEQASVLLTPLPETTDASVALVWEMWQQCGSNVEVLDAQAHDQLLGMTSHLPHVVAYALINTLLHLGDRDIFNYAGGGLRDFTRIAHSNPRMWRDISLSNADCLLGAIDTMQSYLTQMRTFIAKGDGEQLEALFSDAQRALKHDEI